MGHMGKEEVIRFLKDGGYEFAMAEHEPVFTMEGMEALGLPFGEEVVKNLFLRDDKKRNYYLVVMPEDKPANLKELRSALEARPLRFASEEDLQTYLGLYAGAVSPFGVLNDEEATVQVVFDSELETYGGVGVHPNDNTATLHVKLPDLMSIIEAHGNPTRFVELSRPEE
ncbi:MAG: prolyl-tRNA synthetase associated domain-containing protein [Slackia sp.]|nr:prolyl-tRNA synthetase associated domain-containing protein [Slackia sp.]